MPRYFSTSSDVLILSSRMKLTTSTAIAITIPAIAPSIVFFLTLGLDGAFATRPYSITLTPSICITDVICLADTSAIASTISLALLGSVSVTVT